MKACFVIIKLNLLCLMVFLGGCEGPVQPGSGVGPENISIYSGYAAVKLDILPMTGFVSSDQQNKIKKLRVYVSMLDSFNCQIKSPAVFRFELFEFKGHSADRKGNRVKFWKDENDFDLNKPSENNKFWKDYLRSYEFNLPDIEPDKNGSYILLVTSICPDGKRLSAEFYINLDFPGKIGQKSRL